MVSSTCMSKPYSRLMVSMRSMVGGWLERREGVPVGATYPAKACVIELAAQWERVWSLKEDGQPQLIRTFVQIYYWCRATRAAEHVSHGQRLRGQEARVVQDKRLAQSASVLKGWGGVRGTRTVYPCVRASVRA